MRASVQDLSGHHPVFTSARPAHENMGIELGAIALYATGLTHSTIYEISISIDIPCEGVLELFLDRDTEQNNNNCYGKKYQ